MGEKNINVVFKTSLKVVGYLGAVITLACSIFNVWNSIDKGSGIFPIVFMGLMVVYSVLWILHMAKFEINFGPESISKIGVLSKEILYTNFDKATEKLASEIEGRILRLVASKNIDPYLKPSGKMSDYSW